MAARVAKLVRRCAFGTPILKEGEVAGGQRQYHSKERRQFILTFHCDHCAISNHSAVICHRMSATLKSTGVLHLGQNFGRKGFLKRSGRDMGAVVCERNRIDIFSRLSTMHEHDRQTNRPRNGNVDRNRENRLPVPEVL